MKYDTSIELISETNHKWFLQLLDNSGEIVSSNLTTYTGYLEFKASNLSYAFQLENSDTDWNRFDLTRSYSETDGLNLKLTSSHKICATLAATDGTGYPVELKVLGSNEKIDDISLIISKNKDAVCRLSGHESFYGPWELGRKFFHASINVFLELPPEKFDDLARIINSGGADEAVLSLKGVSGLYSENAIPEDDDTSKLKVLLRERKVNIPKDVDIKPHRLLSTKEFIFQLTKAQQKMGDVQSKVTPPINNWAKEEVEKIVKVLSEDTSPKTKDGDKVYLLNDDRAKRLRKTRLYKILNEMFNEASNYAATNKLTLQELDELSQDIWSFSLELQGAFDQDKWIDYDDDPEAVTDRHDREWQLWQYPETDLQNIKNGNIPYIDVLDLNEAVISYLALPVKSKKIDRMLVDALVTSEISSFASEMLYTPQFGLTSSPLMKSHPLWQFLKDQANIFSIIAFIPIVILFMAVELFEFSEDWALIIGLGFVGLWTLILLLGIFALPKSWALETRQKNKTKELLVEMELVRREIPVDAIVSARHLQERLEKTSEKGAIWPSAVFPLLDDIIARGGVL